MSRGAKSTGTESLCEFKPWVTLVGCEVVHCVLQGLPFIKAMLCTIVCSGLNPGSATYQRYIFSQVILVQTY